MTDSTQQRKEENTKRFLDWLDEHHIANDWPAYVNRNKLNRSEMGRECGFGTTPFSQNKDIKDALKEKEDELRALGVLKPIEEGSERSETNPVKESVSRKDKQRLNQLEQQNQSLRAQVDELKNKLIQHNLIDEYLIETGRIPRPKLDGFLDE